MRQVRANNINTRVSYKKNSSPEAEVSARIRMRIRMRIRLYHDCDYDRHESTSIRMSGWRVAIFFTSVFVLYSDYICISALANTSLRHIIPLLALTLSSPILLCTAAGRGDAGTCGAQSCSRRGLLLQEQVCVHDAHRAQSAENSH